MIKLENLHSNNSSRSNMIPGGLSPIKRSQHMDANESPFLRPDEQLFGYKKFGTQINNIFAEQVPRKEERKALSAINNPYQRNRLKSKNEEKERQKLSKIQFLSPFNQLDQNPNSSFNMNDISMNEVSLITVSKHGN